MRSTEVDNTDGSKGKAILLYDGVCGLCHRSVRFLLKRTSSSALCFAPLQGQTATKLRSTHPVIPAALNSVVLVENGRVFFRSKAFFYVSRHLNYPWRALWYFRWVPGLFFDPLYWLIAKVRYRVFGRYDTCSLPDPEKANRFLD